MQPQGNDVPATKIVSVEQLIEQSRLDRFQIGLLLLCGLCLIIDGFDVQAMSYVAPAIIADWHVNKASLGPVFGAGLFGMLLGSLALTPVGDKFGRRPVLILSTLFFAICMLATTQVQSIDHLIIIRFITGLGLGSIMPNAMALVGEFSPDSSRITRMMLVSCGFTVGAAAGGFISAALIPEFGWHAVFLVGGVLPALLGVAMVFWLPESIQFLVLNKRPHDQIARWLSKIANGLKINEETTILVKEKLAQGLPVTTLFREGRAGVTILLWLISFMNLINLYFLSNWLPTLVKDAGYSTGTAVLIGTSLQVGGIVGTLSLGWLIKRFGFTKVLGSCFLLACVCIASIGYAATTPILLFVSVIIAGFCIVGGQPAVNTLAGTFYPTSLRSTGIGWALGIGRIGSVLGPVVGGQLIAMQWANTSLFVAAAVPAFISAMTVLRLHQINKH